MKLNILLLELFQISGVSKTDFALHMNMSPSGLSKLLSEKKSLDLSERKGFASNAAYFFSKSIYGLGCHLKFKNVFPII